MFENYQDILSVDELVKMLGVGRNSAYKLLQENQIKFVKVGRRYLIPKKCVVEFIIRESERLKSSCCECIMKQHDEPVMHEKEAC